MKFSLIQLSDIHLKTAKDRILKMNLSNTLKSAELEKEVVIALTGDITSSGTQDQFSIAENLLNEIIDKLKPKHNVEIVFTAGNHDNDLSEPGFRDTFIDNVWPQSFAKNKPEDIIELMKVQKNYLSFCEKFGLKKARGRIVHEYNHPRLPLKFNLINTAFSSKKKQDKSILFPLNELSQIKRDHSRLNISLYHHPESWLDPLIGNEFRRLLQTYSDFVLTGHEHLEASAEERELGNNRFKYLFRAGALQPHGESEKSEFLIMNYCFTSKEAEIKKISWCRTGSFYKSETFQERFVLPELHDKGFGPSQKLLEHLRDPGISLKHSIKKNISLTDYFVFPMLKIDADALEKAGTSVIIESERECLDFLLKNKKAIIAGEVDTGKTSLGKIVGLELLNKGKIPVWIDVESFNAFNKVHIKNKLEEEFKRLYDGKNLDKARQQYEDDLFLILDSVSFNSTKHGLITDLISQLEDYFPNIIVLADKEFLLEINVSESSSGSLKLDSYSRLTVPDFNKTKRAELIRKWISLGSKNLNQESINKLTAIENQFEEQINNFSIPKRPFYILTMIQHYETEHNYDINCSSNASALDVLVKISLHDEKASRVKPNQKRVFLEEFAYFLFKKDEEALPVESFANYLKGFNKDKGREIALNDILHDLEISNIFASDDRKISFKYPYYRFYFIAQYLSTRMSEPVIRADVQSILDNLSNSQNSNIISFLSLFTKDMMIVDSLVSKLKSSLEDFEKVSIFNFCNHFIEKFKVESVSHLPLMLASEEPDFEYDSKSERSMNQKAAIELNASLRLMRLIGQVLKNSSENLNLEQQKNIVNEVYLLGDRLLGFLNKCVLENASELIKYMYYNVRRSDPNISQLELIEETSYEIANMIFKSVAGVALRVTNSVGHEDMRKVYDEVIGLHVGKESSAGLYDLNIRMNYLDFPHEKLLEFYGNYKENHLSRALIRYLTFQALGSNNPQFHIAQKICSKLEIDYPGHVKKKVSM